MKYDFLINAYKLSDPLGFMSVLQGYGENAVSFYKDMGLDGHPALDLRAQISTHVFASIDGTARVFTDNIHDPVIQNRGQGVWVYSDPIEHEGQQWRIGVLNYHLSEQLVQNNTRVIRGQLIAYTGNTGRLTTGPHDHFGVRPQVMRDGYWNNPEINNGYNGYLDPQLFLTYQKPMADNLYNLYPHTLIKLEEGAGGFGWWNGERFYVDDLAKIQASWMVANGGDIKGKTAHFTQEAWDAYPKKYDLKNNLL